MFEKLKRLDKSKLFAVVLTAVYVVLTLIGALNHELWYDEAEAWNIARDNDLAGIIEQLRYEGHPPLWYLIFYVFSRAGFSCEVIPLISWFFSAVTIIYLFARAPFGNFFKAAIAFSGGFLFVNSVTSRVYCLIPLLVFMIADIYPQRKKHPLLFGLLVGLLANTHICMSGLVGIIGIYMLVDLVTDFKTNKPSQNILNLAGLAIAGLGVLCLVLPLIGSLSSNSLVKTGFTVSGVADAVLQSFTYICMMTVEIYPFAFFFGVLLGIVLLVIFILMRHFRRPFIILLVFTAFFVVITRVIWFIIPARSYLFLYTIAALIWISKSDKAVYGSGKLADKMSSPLLKKLMAAFGRLDSSAERVLPILLACMLAFTIPYGVSYLVRDIAKPFNGSKSAAEFIESSLPENSVLVSDEDDKPDLCAYLPGRKIYALSYDDYYTYVTHKKLTSEGGWSEAAYSELAKYDHVYYVYTMTESDTLGNQHLDIVFSSREGIWFSENRCYIEISDITDMIKENAAQYATNTDG